MIRLHPKLKLHILVKNLFIKSAIVCSVLNSEGDSIYEQTFMKDTIEIGNCIPVGSFSFDPAGIMEAQKLTLEVSIENTPFRNRWDFWVYPFQNEVENR